MKKPPLRDGMSNLQYVRPLFNSVSVMRLKYPYPADSVIFGLGDTKGGLETRELVVSREDGARIKSMLRGGLEILTREEDDGTTTVSVV